METRNKYVQMQLKDEFTYIDNKYELIFTKVTNIHTCESSSICSSQLHF